MIILFNNFTSMTHFHFDKYIYVRIHQMSLCYCILIRLRTASCVSFAFSSIKDLYLVMNEMYLVCPFLKKKKFLELLLNKHTLQKVFLK